MKNPCPVCDKTNIETLSTIQAGDEKSEKGKEIKVIGICKDCNNVYCSERTKIKK